jgi:hypothetical protein
MRRVSSAADLPVPADPSASARRARVRAFIVVAVLAQLLIPLTYYLRDDPYDERFAWRMFSGVRLQECELGVFETRGAGEQAVNPYQVVPAGWVEGLKRNRRRVVERYLTLRCEREGTTLVRVENRCVEVDGTPLPPIEVERDCASGETSP